VPWCCWDWGRGVSIASVTGGSSSHLPLFADGASWAEPQSASSSFTLVPETESDSADTRITAAWNPPRNPVCGGRGAHGGDQCEVQLAAGRWQGDAAHDFIEVRRPNRSNRAVSINSGGSLAHAHTDYRACLGPPGEVQESPGRKFRLVSPIHSPWELKTAGGHKDLRSVDFYAELDQQSATRVLRMVRPSRPTPTTDSDQQPDQPGATRLRQLEP